MPDAEIQIQYVNARNGNRPPSIKDADGNYYTISDDAYQSMLPWKGHSGLISFTVNQKGFKNATHWNGAELPKNNPQGNYHEAAPPRPPSGAVPPPPSQIRPPSGDGQMPPIVSNVVAHAIAAGLITDHNQLVEWMAAAKAAHDTALRGNAPQTVAPPAPNGHGEPPPPSGPDDYGPPPGY